MRELRQNDRYRSFISYASGNFVCQLRKKERKEKVTSPKIIFEDEFLIVIDKPSGVVVNRAKSQKEETIEDWAAGKFIVHRLDKDTSGLLLIAQTPEILGKLQLQFKNREVVKKYLALVHGVVEPGEGTINAPIERSHFNRMHFGVFPGGKAAETTYKIYNGYKNYNGYTLLELTPKTGRTHQIRVHMKYINHPVVSDPIYGGRKNIQADLKFCPRLFLHATYLKINHPKTGEILEFNSPLPPDLAYVLELL